MKPVCERACDPNLKDAKIDNKSVVKIQKFSNSTVTTYSCINNNHHFSIGKNLLIKKSVINKKCDHETGNWHQFADEIQCYTPKYCGNPPETADATLKLKNLTNLEYKCIFGFHNAESGTFLKIYCDTKSGVWRHQNDDRIVKLHAPLCSELIMVNFHNSGRLDTTSPIAPWERKSLNGLDQFENEVGNFVNLRVTSDRVVDGLGIVSCVENDGRCFVFNGHDWGVVGSLPVKSTYGRLTTYSKNSNEIVLFTGSGKSVELSEVNGQYSALKISTTNGGVFKLIIRIFCSKSDQNS